MTTISISKIKKKFKNEWVLLSNFNTDALCEPVSGTVIAHSKDRGEIYDRLMELKRKKKLCIIFTGEVPPKDTAVMFL